MSSVGIKYFLPLAAIFCVACLNSTNEIDSDSMSVELQDTSVIVEVDTLPSLVQHQLRDTIYGNLADLFSIRAAKEIRELNAAFRSYKSNEEFEDIIVSCNDMLDMVTLDLYESPTRFKNEMPQEFGAPGATELLIELDKYADSLLPFVPKGINEIEEVAFYIDFENIQGPCRLTASEADDELVEILRRVYGVYGDLSFHNEIGWFEWWSMDEGWYTFGNDYMYDTFTMLCNFQNKFPDKFVGRIRKIRDELISKLTLDSEDKTQYSRESILREFNQIAALDCLSAKNRADLKSAIKKIETSSTILFETQPY